MNAPAPCTVCARARQLLPAAIARRLVELEERRQAAKAAKRHRKAA